MVFCGIEKRFSLMITEPLTLAANLSIRIAYIIKLEAIGTKWKVVLTLNWTTFPILFFSWMQGTEGLFFF